MATTTLRKLSDTGETVASADEDVRGRKVLDNEEQEIGTVDALMVDDAQQKVRFLRVASGGFLGLDRAHVMIPVEAITRVVPHAVCIDRAREDLRGAPLYDPALVDDTDQAYWGGVYGYYGFAPYWGMGAMGGMGGMGYF
jgi:sporulation protein YlmC with PRC-barrel domain